MPSAVPTSPGIPVLQKALVQDVEGKPKIVNDLPVPELSAGWILVKTTAWALNPCDYKMGTAFPSEGAVIGNDFVGKVVRIHEQTATDLLVGDTVCGLVHGSNPANRANGAFQEYVRAPSDLVLRVPVAFRTEEAAALGSGLTTASVALWESGLGLEINPENPATEPYPVLVYGASTATGTMALQLLRLSGLEPIATCSPRNFQLVRKYGAKSVFNYADPETCQRIKEQTAGDLEYALDCITDRDSVSCCSAAISRFGGHYTCLEVCPAEWRTRRTVEVKFPMALEIFGEELELSKGYGRPASKTKRLTAARWFRVFQKLMDEGKLMAHPIRVISPGFQGIIDGLKILKSGSVSGEKLVVSAA